MNRILHVIPKDNYCLEVMLKNGNSVNIDFSSRLNTVRFSLLADKEYFKTVTTDGSFVRWNYKIEISAREIFELAQRGP